MDREDFTKIDGWDSKLLYCPFCGSRAELWERKTGPSLFHKAAMCTKSGDDFGDGECPLYLPSEGFYQSTKKEAAEVWNTRHNPVTHPGGEDD